jgi:hypothetical protein
MMEDELAITSRKFEEYDEDQDDMLNVLEYVRLRIHDMHPATETFYLIAGGKMYVDETAESFDKVQYKAYTDGTANPLWNVDDYTSYKEYYELRFRRADLDKDGLVSKTEYELLDHFDYLHREDFESYEEEWKALSRFQSSVTEVKYYEYITAL